MTKRSANQTPKTAIPAVTKQKKQKRAHGRRDLGQDHPEQREDEQETNVSISSINDSCNNCVTFIFLLSEC